MKYLYLLGVTVTEEGLNSLFLFSKFCLRGTTANPCQPQLSRFSLPHSLLLTWPHSQGCPSLFPALPCPTIHFPPSDRNICCPPVPLLARRDLLPPRQDGPCKARNSWSWNMQMGDFNIPLISRKRQGPVLPPALQTNSRESRRNLHKEFWAKHPELGSLCHPGKQKHGKGWVLGPQIHGKGSFLLLAELLESLEEPPRISALHRVGGPTLLGDLLFCSSTAAEKCGTLYCCMSQGREMSWFLSSKIPEFQTDLGWKGP